jgi:hypothetical protein
MPQIYKRKSNRQVFNPDSMLLAIQACRENQMGYLKASRQFEVPISSLRRRVNDKNLRAKENKKVLGSKTTSLPLQLEEELYSHIFKMERMFYGLTTTDVRQLAYDLAVANSIPAEQHRFNQEKKLAGWGWLHGFRKRYPNLSLRSPEPTSYARAAGFCKTKVEGFYQMLKHTYDEHSFTPDRIFNLDETGVTNVQGKPSKVFAAKGKHQVGSIKSAERGTNVTVVFAMNVTGNFVPPAFVIPRKRSRRELADNAPPGSLFLYQQRGWMDSEQFLIYLRHFVAHVRPSPTLPVLLILDGHHSHKTLAAIQYSRENGLILLCLPPHCTHKLQPLDVAFFKSFKSYYNKAVENWLRSHFGRVVTIYQIPQLVAEAFEKSATISIAKSGFRATGIYPYNDNIFKHEEFLADDDVPSTGNHQNITPTQIPAIPSSPKPPNANCCSAISAIDIIDLDEPTSSSFLTPSVNVAPTNLLDGSSMGATTNAIKLKMKSSGTSSSSYSCFEREAISTTLTTATNQQYVTPSQIRLMPSFSKPSNRASSASILTLDIMDSNQPTSSSFLTTSANVASPNLHPKPPSSTRAIKRKVKSSSSGATSFSSCIKRKSMPTSGDQSSECIYCNESFSQSRPKEKWIQCAICKEWSHVLCAGYDRGAFLCDFCPKN